MTSSFSNVPPPNVGLPSPSTSANDESSAKNQEEQYTFGNFNPNFDRSPNPRKKKIRNGDILRYPYEALTDKTDYLQIDIVEYSPIGGSLVSNGSNRINERFTNVTEFDEQGNLIPTETSSLKTTRLKSGSGTILLPIPSNIQDGNSVDFAAGNLDGLTAAVYSGVYNAITEEKKSPKNIFESGTYFSQLLQQLAAPFANNSEAFKKTFLAQIAAQAANIPLGGSLTRDAVFARQNGEILNQNVELLFNGVNLRSFKFSFKLTPRGPKEAKQIKLIINTLKRNMAPKLRENQPVFLETPNIFELTYKQGPKKHPFLHTFKQCALTDMSVNYTGEGVYATYAGEEGSPVSMVLELGFKELEPIYDIDYNGDDDLTEGVGY